MKPWNPSSSPRKLRASGRALPDHLVPQPHIHTAPPWGQHLVPTVSPDPKPGLTQTQSRRTRSDGVGDPRQMVRQVPQGLRLGLRSGCRWVMTAWHTERHVPFGGRCPPGDWWAPREAARLHPPPGYPHATDEQPYSSLRALDAQWLSWPALSGLPPHLAHAHVS